MQRIYNSVVRCVGVLGKNWMLGLDYFNLVRERNLRISMDRKTG